MRRQDLDPRIPKFLSGDGVFEMQPRGFQCEGPGPKGETPCPTSWAGLTLGGPVKRCPDCRKIWARVRRAREKVRASRLKTRRARWARTGKS